MTATERLPVGRKKTPEGEEVPKTTTKVAVDLHRKVKMIATARGVEMFDYIDNILRPVVERDYGRMIREEGGER